MTTLRLLSVNVGMPRLRVSPWGETYNSSIGRKPVEGLVTVRTEGIEGDACAYRGHHGLTMAVNAFSIPSYRLVEAALGRTLEIPSFGENLTFEAPGDEGMYVGDLLSWGTVVLRVTQPREPCGNIQRFLGAQGIVKWLRDNLVSGWYCSVEQAGEASAQDPVVIVERPQERWSIRDLNRLMGEKQPSPADVESVRLLEHLSPNWMTSFDVQHKTSPAGESR